MRWIIANSKHTRNTKIKKIRSFHFFFRIKFSSEETLIFQWTKFSRHFGTAHYFVWKGIYSFFKRKRVVKIQHWLNQVPILNWVRIWWNWIWWWNWTYFRWVGCILVVSNVPTVPTLISTWIVFSLIWQPTQLYVQHQ